MATAKKAAAKKAPAKKAATKNAVAKKPAAKKASAKASAGRGVRTFVMTMGASAPDGMSDHAARNMINKYMLATSANLAKLMSLVAGEGTDIDTSLSTEQGKALKALLISTNKLNDAIQHRIPMPPPV
jgi:hypothetical protein